MVCPDGMSRVTKVAVWVAAYVVLVVLTFTLKLMWPISSYSHDSISKMNVFVILATDTSVPILKKAVSLFYKIRFFRTETDKIINLALIIVNH